MIEKLDFLVRFWELRARYEALGIPLTESERVELLSLVQLVAAADEVSEPGPAPRARRALPVQLTARSGFLSGDLREVCGEQLIVAAADLIAPGDRAIMYLADAVTGVEYALPCRVVWAHKDSPCAMGFVVDGIPTRSTFTVPVGGMLRSPLGNANVRASA